MSKEGRSGNGSVARKQFLVHIDAELIRRVKILAVERGVSASSLAQEATIKFLARGNVARAQD